MGLACVQECNPPLRSDCDAETNEIESGLLSVGKEGSKALHIGVIFLIRNDSSLLAIAVAEHRHQGGWRHFQAGSPLVQQCGRVSSRRHRETAITVPEAL